MKIRKITFIVCTYAFVLNQEKAYGKTAGVDIGNRCKIDADCKAGNGGPFSKCHKPSSTCICTINIIGDSKCNYGERTNSSKRKSLITLYEKENMSAMECTPEDEATFIFTSYQNWFTTDAERFTSLRVNDNKTAACFDPDRAFNTVPDGIVIKNSSIPNAGLGVFTDMYIEKGTIFGPCKGIYYKGNFTLATETYVWELHSSTYNETIRVDGVNIYLSNWVRFLNMAPTVDTLNVILLEYENMYYYYALRSIQPGTELQTWYSAEAAKPFGIKPFRFPHYALHAPTGFAGGLCSKTNGDCLHDENAVCIQQLCVCKAGTHYRYSSCIPDETLGGTCDSSDGNDCRMTSNAVCMEGVCVCKKGTTVFKDMCIFDETYGGICRSPNGHDCLLDSNAECVSGICMCKYSSSEVGGKCMPYDMAGGKCLLRQEGEPCLHENNGVCKEGLCNCVEGTSNINGKCVKDGSLG